MSKSFTCPYCNQVFPLTRDTYSARFPSFTNDISLSKVTRFSASPNPENDRYPDEIKISFYKCPNCGEISISYEGLGSKVSSLHKSFIKPISLAKQFPDYIPQPIREDYEEAHAILNLSPKASATLARRCLQAMIRDFWNIHGKTLYDEITKLKDHIPPIQWRVLDSFRKLGNIGAHMEHDINKIVDIDPDEAEKLLKLIEKLLSDWYINKHETDKLYEDIISISNQKEDQRKGNR